MSDIKVYHKKGCGTCRKALDWLHTEGAAVDEIDILANPPDRAFLEKWVEEGNVKAYLNPRSKIYREKKLAQNPPTKKEAIDLMLRDSNLIRRPVIMKGDQVGFGFDADFLNRII